jgi:hypothetical protein
MATPQYHDTHEIVIAATRWMASHASNPQLADACQRLLFDWRTVSRPHEAVSAAPQPTVH